jgi:hypothetical protein
MYIKCDIGAIEKVLTIIPPLRGWVGLILLFSTNMLPLRGFGSLNWTK